MRVRGQTAIGEVNAPAIEEVATGRDGDEHGRVTVLRDADGRGSLRSSSSHAFEVAHERNADGRICTSTLFVHSWATMDCVFASEPLVQNRSVPGRAPRDNSSFICN